MKNLISSIVFSFLLLFLYGCASSSYTISRFGDKATLTFVTGDEFTCELISVLDSTIIFTPLPEHHYDYTLQPQTLYQISKNEVKSITIQGFDGKSWGTSVILMQAVPLGMIIASALSVDMDVGPVIKVFGVPLLLTAAFFAVSNGETPSWSYEDSLKAISDLNIYSRYPNGLSLQNIDTLLKKSKQKELQNFKVK